MDILRWTGIAAWVGAAGWIAAPLRAQEAPGNGQGLPPIIVQATAIPGDALAADKVPGNVQSLDAADLARDGAASLPGALGARLGSVNIDEDLDDPFQPDLLYRGFAASPVLGTPQGLAVYQNGVRINEAFGDTVNWDLIPDFAIRKVELVSANPLYGRNALGGAVAVSMKNGFTDPGTDAEVSGGSFERRAALMQYGVRDGPFALYAAGQALEQSGWRSFASDSLRQLYAAATARSDHASLELAVTAADNRLDGQGAAPVQELAVSRSLTFTGPQANTNRLEFLTLSGSLELAGAWALQGLLYDRLFRQSVANGNTTRDTACTSVAGAGLLCQPDGVTVLTDTAGAPLPDLSRGGTVAIGETDLETIHADGNGAALQVTAMHSLAGHESHFSAGATLDAAVVDFDSAIMPGVLNPQLLVLPSALIVDTTEAQQNAALAAGDATLSATPVSLVARTQALGLYATESLDLTPVLSLTASGRYEQASIDLQDRLGHDLSGDNRYSHFNPGLGATLQLRPGFIAYAGFAENTRTPTASEIECSDPHRPCLLPSSLAGDPPTLREVVAQTTEIGLRSRSSPGRGGDRAWSWNLGLFRTRLHDDIYGIATSASSGFFQNIGATRRQGIEAGGGYRRGPWSLDASYSLIEATFESALTLSSPSNPLRDRNGNLHVQPGDRLPGIPRQRLKLAADCMLRPRWSVGLSFSILGNQYYFGDESNQLAPMPGYSVLGLHGSFQASPRVQLYASLSNVLDAKYATYGILGDPTGIGAPGIPARGSTNGPGVDNRFQSPAAPFAVFGGVRIRLD